MHVATRTDPNASPPPAHIAVEPDCWRRAALVEAVERGGGTVVGVDRASALVWADPARPDALPPLLGPHIDWVQLPYAGAESFLDLLDRERTWTCGKGVYARPVAEHALASILALLRGFVPYARAHTWTGPRGANLDGSRVTVVGGGGITEQLLTLLAPFRCEVTVVRRAPVPFPGAHRTTVTSKLGEVLPETDVLVLALALTPETEGIIDGRRLALLPDHAVLVNVARGRHVVTDDLVAALRAGTIAGAVLDVTDPEPLPDDHPLWDIDTCLVTPHVANTPEMGLVLLADRVADNVTRRLAGMAPTGTIDLDLGY